MRAERKAFGLRSKILTGSRPRWWKKGLHESSWKKKRRERKKTKDTRGLSVAGATRFKRVRLNGKTAGGRYTRRGLKGHARVEPSGEDQVKRFQRNVRESKNSWLGSKWKKEGPATFAIEIWENLLRTLDRKRKRTRGGSPTYLKLANNLFTGHLACDQEAEGSNRSKEKTWVGVLGGGGWVPPGERGNMPQKGVMRVQVFSVGDQRRKNDGRRGKKKDSNVNWAYINHRGGGKKGGHREGAGHETRSRIWPVGSLTNDGGPEKNLIRVAGRKASATGWKTDERGRWRTAGVCFRKRHLSKNLWTEEILDVERESKGGSGWAPEHQLKKRGEAREMEKAQKTLARMRLAQGNLMSGQVSTRGRECPVLEMTGPEAAELKAREEKAGLVFQSQGTKKNGVVQRR